MLEDILARLDPGWLPVELAVAHYQALDPLNLSLEQIDTLAKNVGERIQNTVLVSAAKRTRDSDFDIWSEAPSFHRMWSRLYQGGSVQIRKLGPRQQLNEVAFLLAWD